MSAANVNTFIQTATGQIDAAAVQGALPDREFRDAWRLDGQVVSIDVDLMKPLAKDMVTAWREAANTAPIAVAGITYAADQASQDLVDRATQLAEKVEGAGRVWSTEWSDVNGAPVPMDKEKIDALGVAIGLRTGELHVAARAKKAAIDAATTEAEIRTVLAGL